MDDYSSIDRDFRYWARAKVVVSPRTYAEMPLRIVGGTMLVHPIAQESLASSHTELLTSKYSVDRAVTNEVKELLEGSAI